MDLIRRIVAPDRETSDLLDRALHGIWQGQTGECGYGGSGR